MIENEIDKMFLKMLMTARQTIITKNCPFNVTNFYGSETDYIPVD